MKLPVDLPAAVAANVRRYLAAEWRGGDAQVQRCDVVLALLRLNSPAARTQAERIMGKKITVCPPAVPPWPPDPIPARFRKPVVTRVAAPNPCAPRSDAHRRFADIRVGMTREQLTCRGITQRDVRVWQDRGWLTLSPKETRL